MKKRHSLQETAFSMAHFLPAAILGLLLGLAPPPASAETGGLFEAPTVAFDPGDPQYPMARVNGVAVTQGQVENVVRQLLAQQRGAIPPARMGEVRENLARQARDLLIGRELLAQEAARHGIEITRDELGTAVDGLRANIPAGQTLDDALRGQGLTRSALEANLIRELRVNRLIERIGTGLDEPDEARVAAFYEENTEQFDVGESVSLRHILVGMMNSDDDKVRDVRRRKAEALRRQVVDGSDFANLAMLHSDDATRANGGEVGFITRDRVQPALADTAFSLEVNEVSPVVESPAGFHILQVLDRRTARQVPLEEVREQIQNLLTQQAREAAVQELVAKLREDAEIEILR